MIEATGSTRRGFLKDTATLAAAGATLAAGVNIARSAHAAGDDVVKIALIGCGGRGTGAVNDCLSSTKNVKLVALADVFTDRAQVCAKTLRKILPDKVDLPEERIFIGCEAYRQALDAGVDSVILTTPPGFRPLHYAAAVAAGKHVFMEKPCCIDAPGFRKLMETNKLAEAKGLKVAAGMQRRHSQEYIPKIAKLHDGAIGDIVLLRGYWNGNFLCSGFGSHPKEMSEMEFQIRNWNFFRWLSGDHIVEQHVHNIDVCNWVKNAHPAEANGMGSRQSRMRAQIFDNHMVEFTYADGAKFYSQCRQSPGCWDCITEAVVGTKGKLGLGGNGSDGYQQEHVDLINAIRTGGKLHDGWHAATSSMTGVLGRMATYSGQLVRWDDAVAKGPSEMPERFALDANPPALPDKYGNYAVPIPGIYKPY